MKSSLSKQQKSTNHEDLKQKQDEVKAANVRFSELKTEMHELKVNKFTELQATEKQGVLKNFANLTDDLDETSHALLASQREREALKAVKKGLIKENGQLKEMVTKSKAQYHFQKNNMLSHK